MVLALIDANNLYRGTEHRAAVASFQKAQQRYLHSEHPDRFIWSEAQGNASRFQNTVIGTLVQDLSSGVDAERAVGAFEAKVAPHNYKRTSAIITPRMIKEAMDTIEALELEPALERRFARIDDISANDVLWVDNAVKPLMKGRIGDMVMRDMLRGNSLALVFHRPTRAMSSFEWHRGTKNVFSMFKSAGSNHSIEYDG